MTRVYIHPAAYICDGCGVRAVGWDDRLPEGWKQSDPAVYPHGTTHYCPACVPPEVKP